MGQEFLSLFQLETKRLLWLIGVTFAVILTFQYLEFPYGTVLVSLFSADKIPTPGSSTFKSSDVPSKFKLVSNVTLVNPENFTVDHAFEIANKTLIFGGNETIPRTSFVLEPGHTSNMSLGFDGFDQSIMRPDRESETQQAEDLGPCCFNKTTGLSFSPNHFKEDNVSSHEQKYESPYFSSTNVSTDIITAVLSNDSTISLFQKDNITNSIKEESASSSLSDAKVSVPSESKDYHTPIPEVTTVFEMKKLLLQSQASYRAMVCKSNVKFQFYYND